MKPHVRLHCEPPEGAESRRSQPARAGSSGANGCCLQHQRSLPAQAGRRTPRREA